MLLEIKMPPFLFGGCVLVGQIYFVYVKGFVGLYDCRTGGHIPFNVKSVFLVEVGKVFVVRVLRYIVLIAEKGRTPRNCKIHFPPSITAISSCVINSLPQCQVMNSKMPHYSTKKDGSAVQASSILMSYSHLHLRWHKEW